MSKILLGLLLITGLTIASCECESGASGRVFRSDTQEPLSGVSILFSFDEGGKLDTTGTDSEGYYTVGGLGGRCRSTKIIFNKDGYVTQSLSIPKGDYLDQDTYLVKE